jgi:putative transcriptional regulator
MRIVLLLLLAFALPAMGEDAPDDLSSIFLVAQKDSRDPYFRDSVVLVTHRIGPTPIGVILNRPTGITVESAIPDSGKASLKAELVHFGGPVAIDQVIVVFRAKNPPPNSVEIMQGIYMTMDREGIRSLLDRKLSPKDIRFFAGYAGWALGQLEAEVASGGWVLLRADAATLFEKKSDGLWQELYRKGSSKKARAGAAGTFAP